MSHPDRNFLRGFIHYKFPGSIPPKMVTVHAETTSAVVC